MDSRTFNFIKTQKKLHRESIVRHLQGKKSLSDFKKLNIYTKE